MIDPVVRRATGGDEVRLRELEREARAALVDARGGARWLEEHPEVHWSDDAADRAVFVAVLETSDDHDGLVAGYLVLDRHGDITHVDQVYVTPEARELGFGDALLEMATVDSRRAGARLLEGHALPGDRNMKNLYERAGITARLITVSTKLA